MKCKSQFVCRRKEIAKRILEIRAGLKGLAQRKQVRQMVAAIINKEFAIPCICGGMPKKAVIQDYLMTQWVTTTLKDKFLESVWVNEYGDSWRKIALFKDEGQSDEDVLYDCGYSYYYSGPGRGFAGEPVVERNGHSIIVTWFGGLDV